MNPIEELESTRRRLAEGLAIPACPLPLQADGSWSEVHQRAILRYYHQAGAGGVAVGVHTTQFEIRDPKHGLLEPVLTLAARELAGLDDRMVRVAGICGRTPQALAEAELARGLGYHAGLVSLAALQDAQDDALVDHCRAIAEVLPVFGFYLQPAVGGRILSLDFWRKFAAIPNVVGIKIAPFNRYQTLDVVRAVIESGRQDVALYTGNDDNILLDLVTPYTGWVEGRPCTRFIQGGLLGQWAIWTRAAVQFLERAKQYRQGESLPRQWLQQQVALTDINAALFDAANQFAGCLPGIMEVLRRVGLAPSAVCLNPTERLSPGQAEELDRVTDAYPEFVDDDFVRRYLPEWLSDGERH